MNDLSDYDKKKYILYALKISYNGIPFETTMKFLCLKSGESDTN